MLSLRSIWRVADVKTSAIPKDARKILRD